MAFTFEKASSVVVGTFNMYILHPQWLTKHGIVAEGVEFRIETNFSQPGFRFHFPENKATWSVLPNRLAIESQDCNFDCGRAIADILRLLPETPLVAMGNNVHYQASESELDGLSDAIQEFPRMESIENAHRVQQRTFHTEIKRNEYQTINLQLSLEPDSVKLVCNIHTELSDRDDFSEAATMAAGQFLEDRSELQALAKHFFGTSIAHGSDDT